MPIAPAMIVWNNKPEGAVEIYPAEIRSGKTPEIFRRLAIVHHSLIVAHAEVGVSVPVLS
jgi:hypothetical protein